MSRSFFDMTDEEKKEIINAAADESIKEQSELVEKWERLSKCQNCKEHQGTESWIGDGNMLSAIHGGIELWCKCCVLAAQIDHTELLMKSLDKKKEELKKLDCK